MGHVAGLLLAAGAGRRMGRPKALVADPDGTSWLVRATTVLDSVCAPVRVVLGASARDAAELLEGLDVEVVLARDWADGMGASLRAGLTGLEGVAPDAEAALVHLVDLPDVTDAVLARVAAHAAPDVLARATYDGRPGHPVLLGRDHWAAVATRSSGDEGARAYLSAHEVVAVECGDLATGHDVDTRP